MADEHWDLTYRPKPRRCACGALVRDGVWYGGQGGTVILDAEPTTVVRFVGGGLTAWACENPPGVAREAAFRSAARFVSFDDDVFSIHVCPAQEAGDNPPVQHGGDA